MLNYFVLCRNINRTYAAFFAGEVLNLASSMRAVGTHQTVGWVER